MTLHMQKCLQTFARLTWEPNCVTCNTRKKQIVYMLGKAPVKHTKACTRGRRCSSRASRGGPATIRPCARASAGRPPARLYRETWQILQKFAKLKFCEFLTGSFSAVSKQNFATKYAFDSIFQALQDLHPFAPLQSQNFRKKSG